jgi:transposase
MQAFATMQATSGRSPRRLEVLTGPERRRSYQDADKMRLVAETLKPGVCVAALARRHGLHPQQLYTWRRQARRGELALLAEAAPMFAAVVEAPEPAAAAMQISAGNEVVVELGDQLRLRIGPEVAPARVAALVEALRSAG